MRKMARDFYIPKGSTKVADKQSDAIAYLKSFQGRGRDGQPVTRYEAAIFFGQQAKPVAHYTYRSEAARERSMRELFERRRGHDRYVTERREKAKAFQHNVNVGDIFNTSWGYDQTNVEFFEVVDVRGKHAILRQIGAASVDDGSGCERTVAQSGAYLEPRHENDRLRKPLRRLIQDGHIEIDDVRTAHPWGQRDAITGTIIGRAMHQTAAGWGH